MSEPERGDIELQELTTPLLSNVEGELHPALAEIQPVLRNVMEDYAANHRRQIDPEETITEQDDVNQVMDRIHKSKTCNFRAIEMLDAVDISQMGMPGLNESWLSLNNGSLQVLRSANGQENSEIIDVAKYDAISCIAVSSAFAFVATEESGVFNIRTFSVRTHQEHDNEIISNVYTSPIKKMIATEDVLITLGAEDNPVVRFWKIESRNFNKVFASIEEHVMTTAVKDAADISYWNGLLAIAFDGENPKIQIWGAHSLVKSQTYSDEKFRRAIFGDKKKPEPVVQIPKWVWNTGAVPKHIQFYNGRIVFTQTFHPQVLIQFVDVDIYSNQQAQIGEIEEVGGKMYSNIARCGDFLVAILPAKPSRTDEERKPSSITVWDFNGALSRKESIIVQKDLAEDEQEQYLLNLEGTQLFAGVRGVVLTFDGSKYYYFKLQSQDGETTYNETSYNATPFIFTGKNGEIIVRRWKHEMYAQDIRTGSKTLLHSVPERVGKRCYDTPLWAGEKLVVPRSRLTSITSQDIVDVFNKPAEPHEEVGIVVHVFESSGQLAGPGKFELAQEGEYTKNRWRIVCNRYAIALLDLPVGDDAIYVTFFNLSDGKKLGSKVPIYDLKIDPMEILGSNHLKGKKATPMKMLLDDEFRLFFIGEVVTGFDFLNDEKQRLVYDNLTYMSDGNATQNDKAERLWSCTHTMGHLICWKYVANLKNINSYIINVFDKKTEELVKIYEFDSKNNEKDFYVSVAECKDQQNFVVMESRNETDRITNEVRAVTQLYFASILTFNLQPVAKIPGLQRVIYPGKDCFVLVSHPYLKDHKKEMTIKRWSISANLAPIAYIHQLQKMSSGIERSQPYIPQLKNCIIFPEMINYTQIYATRKSRRQLAASLRDGCPLLVSRQGTSALNIAISLEHSVMISGIIKTIIKYPDMKYERQLDGHVFELMEMGVAGLDKVLDNSMIPYNTNVPEYNNIKKSTEIKVIDSQILDYTRFSAKKPAKKPLHKVIAKKPKGRVQEVMLAMLDWIKKKPETANSDGEEQPVQTTTQENKDAVEYSMSAFKVDTKYGSKESNRLIELLLTDDNEDLLKTEIFKLFTDQLWKAAWLDILVVELYYMVFALLLTFYIFFLPTSSAIQISLMILLFPLLYQEVKELINNKLAYFKYGWNLIDFLRVVFCYWLLISVMVEHDYSEDSWRGLKAVSLMLSWLRLSSFFRLMPGTRYLIRTVIDIGNGTIPFWSILFYCIFSVGIAFNALRGNTWVEAFTQAYRLALGDFEEVEDAEPYASIGEKIVFFFSSIVLPLLLLNLLLAIMGDIYAQVQEKCEVADIREKLALIQEASNYFCSSGSFKGYLHVCKKQELGDSDGADWAGSVGTIKTAVLEKLNKVENGMLRQLQQLQSEFDDLDKRIENRNHNKEQSDRKQLRQTKHRWTNMENELIAIEDKLDAILKQLDEEGINQDKNF